MDLWARSRNYRSHIEQPPQPIMLSVACGSPFSCGTMFSVRGGRVYARGGGGVFKQFQVDGKFLAHGTAAVA